MIPRSLHDHPSPSPLFLTPRSFLTSVCYPSSLSSTSSSFSFLSFFIPCPTSFIILPLFSSFILLPLDPSPSGPACPPGWGPRRHRPGENPRNRLATFFTEDHRNSVCWDLVWILRVEGGVGGRGTHHCCQFLSEGFRLHREKFFGPNPETKR